MLIVIVVIIAVAGFFYFKSKDDKPSISKIKDFLKKKFLFDGKCADCLSNMLRCIMTDKEFDKFAKKSEKFQKNFINTNLAYCKHVCH